MKVLLNVKLLRQTVHCKQAIWAGLESVGLKLGGGRKEDAKKTETTNGTFRLGFNSINGLNPH